MTVPKAEQGAVDQRSLHERIAADLRDEIMSGDLPPGAKLPSTAQLKERFTASNATVQKALHLLKDEGLAVGRAGAAARVPTQEQYTVLGLPGSLPALRTLRVVYSDGERPIEATVMAKAGHLYELQYEFSPS
ncbi:GntR family transcriptional regulator [Streptomyces sp. PRh5]|uniref:winged helix-turn-helix domain-containing protein n=1 Tax=Streptomyces sp. PRh5 TaxID=1158056 RepID=UPI000448302B|nr:GntR family transcriptional regulator [Streptomyces sp. PRh5]EXU63876.1 GntR family transcriptional regulator [Streptomyces sp. PRh5]